MEKVTKVDSYIPTKSNHSICTMRRKKVLKYLHLSLVRISFQWTATHAPFACAEGIISCSPEHAVLVEVSDQRTKISFSFGG